MEPIILASGTDYLMRYIQTAYPIFSQMTLGFPPAPSCREKSVPLGHRGEEEEVHVSALCSISPQAEVLPEVHSSCEGLNIWFFDDFTRSFITDMFFLKQTTSQLFESPGYSLMASLVLVVKEKNFNSKRFKSQVAYSKTAG